MESIAKAAGASGHIFAPFLEDSMKRSIIEIRMDYEVILAEFSGKMKT